MQNNVTYRREIPVRFTPDVLVVGGGPAGVAAAIAAARSGVSVLLLEKSGMLGGMATQGLVGPFMTCYDTTGRRQVIQGIFDEVCRRLEALGGAIHPSKTHGDSTFCSFINIGHDHVTPYSSELMQCLLDEMVAESGAELLLYTQMVDVVCESGEISYVLAHGKEGLFAVRAKQYIDCTGDADLSAAAGVKTVLGDPASGYIQPASLIFEIEGVDSKRLEQNIRANNEQAHRPYCGSFSWFVEKGRKTGEWDIERNEIGMYETNQPGRYKINTTRMANVDATRSDQMTAAHVEGRRQVLKVFAFIRKYVPGCEHASLVQIASVLGVRESRHICGRYTLTKKDVLERTPFTDAIAMCAYHIDAHAAKGGGGKHYTLNGAYQIPYASALPLGCGNLLVGGRAISATSEAAASFRIMPGCFAIGQAVGTAAALSVQQNCAPAALSPSTLRTALLSQNVILE